MLNFFPYKHFSIKTSLSLENLVNIISDSISPARYSVWEIPVPNRKKFHGTVSAQGFTISIPQDMRNSFTIFMFGKFIPIQNEVKIDIRLTLHPLVMIPITFVWLIIVSGFIYYFATTGTVSNEVLIVIILSYLFIRFAFFIEASQLEQFIRTLIEDKRKE